MLSRIFNIIPEESSGRLHGVESLCISTTMLTGISRGGMAQRAIGSQPALVGSKSNVCDHSTTHLLQTSGSARVHQTLQGRQKIVPREDLEGLDKKHGLQFSFHIPYSWFT